MAKGASDLRRQRQEDSKRGKQVGTSSKRKHEGKRYRYVPNHFQ